MFVNLITQTEQSRTNNRAYAPVPPPRCGMPVSDNILKESTKLPFYDRWARRCGQESRFMHEARVMAAATSRFPHALWAPHFNCDLTKMSLAFRALTIFGVSMI